MSEALSAKRKARIHSACALAEPFVDTMINSYDVKRWVRL
jgi:hypothetical protein